MSSPTSLKSCGHQQPYSTEEIHDACRHPGTAYLESIWRGPMGTVILDDKIGFDDDDIHVSATNFSLGGWHDKF